MRLRALARRRLEHAREVGAPADTIDCVFILRIGDAEERRWGAAGDRTAHAREAAARGDRRARTTLDHLGALARLMVACIYECAQRSIKCTGVATRWHTQRVEHTRAADTVARRSHAGILRAHRLDATRRSIITEHSA
jgi:hypothetical protein